MSFGPSAAITLSLAALAGGCKAPPEQRYLVDPAAVARGRTAIERAGCSACHSIAGIDWPQGRLGPSLAHYGDTGLIAGALANTPDNLAKFIRNAPAAKPGSTMPAMPVSEAEARDIASYLMASEHD